MTTRDRRLARAARLEGWADKRTEKGNAQVDQARASASVIPFGQPMLTDHHSYKGDRNRRNRIASGYDRGFDNLRTAKTMQSKAANIRAAADHAIYSDDVDAIARLAEKVATLTAERDRIKAFNSSCKRVDGGDVSLLDDMQQTSLASIKRVAPYQLGKRGEFPAYATANIGATIRKAQQRLDDLRASAVAS